MKNALEQFSTSTDPSERKNISEKFVTWGPSGVNFLLEEYTTNRYGHSNESGLVMDMSYPNWREIDYLPTKDQGEEEYYCKYCGDFGMKWVGDKTCPNCGKRI